MAQITKIGGTSAVPHAPILSILHILFLQHGFYHQLPQLPEKPVVKRLVVCGA
jgi:hypothetical protein